MRVIKVSAGSSPIVINIEHNLESLQKEVGGYIQAVYPYEDPIAIICNEEGKINGLPLNRALCDEDGNVYDIIAGDFLITGICGDNFSDISDEYINKYVQLFKQPETFINYNGRIIVCKLEEN